MSVLKYMQESILSRFSLALSVQIVGVILLLLTASGNLLAEQKLATNSCLAQLTEPGLSADDSIDAYATEKYSAAVSNMLAAEEFKQLDCLADSLRESQARFASGAWKLNIFYSGLEAPLLHPTENDWKDHLKRLKNWQYENPESITARIALAEADLSYAWDARGNQGADTVSDNGWQLFGQRAAEARKILEKASSLKAKCPEWYVAMETVALAQGWERPEAEAVVEEAFSKDPRYYHVYQKYAMYLLPRWYGEEGDTEAFAASIADRIGGDQGDAVYYKIAVSVVCNCKTEPQLERMSWPRIQKGFATLEKQNGVSMPNLNIFALMAIKRNDSVVADQMFRRSATAGTNRSGRIRRISMPRRLGRRRLLPLRRGWLPVKRKPPRICRRLKGRVTMRRSGKHFRASCRSACRHRAETGKRLRCWFRLATMA